MVLGKVVDWPVLGEVIIASIVAGLGITLCFSLAILGAIRAADTRRAERGPQAIAWAVLGVVGLVASVAAVGGALIVMTSKG